MEVQSNILDPIHPALPESVWDHPEADQPKLKEQHRKWIRATVVSALESAGYTHVETWLKLVLTGSLTTYQYSDQSDCDVSLFVDAEAFPEWSRAEMISLMVGSVDGTTLPGTGYPMQCFVVAKGTRPEDLYKPGLRSGYDLHTDTWVQPPERSRVHDVQREMYFSYVNALLSADKMESLLKHDPDAAVDYWHFLHEKRRRDQAQGLGDYAESNIIYKFLANRGLFPEISKVTGEYIANTAARFTGIDPGHVRHRVDHLAVEKARHLLGIRAPVNVRTVGGVSGGYHGMNQMGEHEISVVGWLKPKNASKQGWHELAHAKQYEEGERFGDGYHAAYEQGHDAYVSHPTEVEANRWYEKSPWPLAHAVRTSASWDRQVAKFVYDPVDNRLVVGHMAGEEGEVESHYDLMNTHGFDLEHGPMFGQISVKGYVETFGRPMITGFGAPQMNQYEADWRLHKAVLTAFPDARFTGNNVDLPNPRWEEFWTEPSIEYVGERPTIHGDAQPLEEGVWAF